VRHKVVRLSQTGIGLNASLEFQSESNGDSMSLPFIGHLTEFERQGADLANSLARRKLLIQSCEGKSSHG